MTSDSSISKTFYIQEPITQSTFNMPNDGYSTNNFTIRQLKKVVIQEPNEKQKKFFDEIGVKHKLVGNISDGDWLVGETPEQILDELCRNYDFWFNTPICLSCTCEDCCIERADLSLKRENA